ncbi:HAD-IIA family hydrolase [Pseudomonas sp. RIT-PI-AD]|uniref:HAD-IIA family hydrolase n=1 Tax=Pseudomonas sp. RIT-PI-AD TaxID=3035294 RepID=UPI0021D8EE17|nr:HAD-IIA family hydrolase [Pseudomonas sp. RIT-PI-AD]
MEMLGIILAAGVGSRLRPMTNSKPKCLVTTAGKPILQYQIDAYKQAGFDRLLIVVGYEGHAIREYCKHIKGIRIEIVENADYEITNNMYSLHLCRAHAKGRPFVLNNADLGIDPQIVARLMAHDAADAVAVDTSTYNRESMKITLDAEGYIDDISKGIDEADAFACSIDFYKFSGEASEVFFDEIGRIVESERNLKDWTEVAMQRLFRSGRLRFMPCDIAGLDWVEVDNYDDLARSDRTFSKLDERLQEIDTVLLDLDGTVYIGREEVQGASRAVEKLKAQGKNVFFLSNNSSKNKADHVSVLRSIGVDSTPAQIVLSTDALVDYLVAANVEKIHVLGTRSFKTLLTEQGFQVEASEPEYVVVGYDTELDYRKLVDACKHINAGTDILATHGDAFCPSEHGPIPDIGALLAMIKMATGKEPKRVFGKPSSDMVLPLIRRFGLDPKRTLIVGDRLHTDILMAKNLASYGLLVLTGATTRDQLESSPIVPDFVINSIGHL